MDDEKRRKATKFCPRQLSSLFVRIRWSL